MMSNRNLDILYQLIKSLEKSEKRHFKLYIKRSSNNEELKIIQLFDALDKLRDYDEKLLLKRLVNIEKPQLANLKTHLYKQILSSLRLLKNSDNLDLQLNEQLDFARILYNKGLKHQSLRTLERVKEIARANYKFSFLTQIITLEKKIETLHITRSTLEKTENLAREALEVSDQIGRVARLSNLALLLYGWYVKNGHARNEEDEIDVKHFFKENLLDTHLDEAGFYEKLYLYQSYVWYAFIRQDFLMYYRYSQKWIDLFEKEEMMKAVEIGHYIKGMHNLLNAHFDLRNFEKFEIALKQFEAFANTPLANHYDNFRVHTFIYINSAKINQHLMLGTFSEGLLLIKSIELKLEEYSIYVDKHRILVFNYKFATLFFGHGDYATCIDYLQKIINDQLGLRNDLQCYARLMHLMAHYELGNTEIIEYLIKSVYRFMAKMQNLTVIEEEMFKFLRKSFNISPRKMHDEFELFLTTIKKYEKSRFETRAFAYLDIISWVESKVYNKPMSYIINQKYLASKKRVYSN